MQGGKGRRGKGGCAGACFLLPGGAEPGRGGARAAGPAGERWPGPRRAGVVCRARRRPSRNGPRSVSGPRPGPLAIGMGERWEPVPFARSADVGRSAGVRRAGVVCRAQSRDGGEAVGLRSSGRCGQFVLRRGISECSFCWLLGVAGTELVIAPGCQFVLPAGGLASYRKRGSAAMRAAPIVARIAGQKGSGRGGVQRG